MYSNEDCFNGSCSNCGRKGGGYMSSTEWAHNYKCCSDLCGFRLKKRIDNKMFPDFKELHGWPVMDRGRADRLRAQVQFLKSKIRRLRRVL